MVLLCSIIFLCLTKLRAEVFQILIKNKMLIILIVFNLLLIVNPGRAFTFHTKNRLTGVGNNEFSTELIAGDYVLIFDNTGLTGDSNPNGIKIDLTILFIGNDQNRILQLQQVIDIKRSDYNTYLFQYQEDWDVDRIIFQITKAGNGPITMFIVDASELATFEEELEIFKTKQGFNSHLSNFILFLFIIILVIAFFILIFMMVYNFSKESNKTKNQDFFTLKRHQQIRFNNNTDKSIVIYCGNCGQPFPVNENIFYCGNCGQPPP